MTRRARDASRKRRRTGLLALVGSLAVIVFGDAREADAASLVDPYSPSVVASAPTPATPATTVPLERTPPPGAATTTTTTPVTTSIAVTGSGSRVVVRVGSLLFALGGIVSYIASGTRRRS